jgi:hypothetical protein
MAIMKLISKLFESLFEDTSQGLSESPDTPSIPVMRPRSNVSRSLRDERLRNEILMPAQRFANTGGICYDEENLDWIMIPSYPLPERWKERWCKILIVPPVTYPETPPIGFYLNRKFHLKSGSSDPHATGRSYDGAPDLLKSGWHWYCVTIQDGPGGWQPSADYRQPDNLFTFMNMVRESLTNDF